MKAFIAIILLASSVLTKVVPGIPNGRIVNGVNATVKQAPYIVSISSYKTYDHICGGSIIDKEWILTAGHCLPRSGKVQIYAGITNITNRTNGHQRFSDYAIIHPEYPTDGSVAPYDIALLHLDEPLVFNELVKPIALPYPGEVISGTGKVYGWGRTSSFKPSPDILQSMEVDILQYEECKHLMKESSPLHPVNVCSSTHNKHFSVCAGDSGGPFVKEFPGGVTQLVGVSSWAYTPCGLENIPSVFTKVSAFIEWIAKAKAEYYTRIRFCNNL